MNTTEPGELPRGEAKAKAVREMFDTIAPRYDLVNRIMTFRLDTRWRRRTVAALELEPGSTVVDLACGTGDFCVDLEAGGHNAVGFDLSLGMLRAARTTAPLVHADILALPVRSASVDAATCGFALRNLVELPPLFSELARVLRPRGRIGLLDVAEPENRVLRWGHHVYFDRIVPKVGGLLSDRHAYEYLPKSVAYLPEPEVLVAQIESAGFVDVDRRLLAPGSAQLITATRA